jgi:hypothetical protein
VKGVMSTTFTVHDLGMLTDDIRSLPRSSQDYMDISG